MQNMFQTDSQTFSEVKDVSSVKVALESTLICDDIHVVEGKEETSHEDELWKFTV